jgi:hypothetical protein
MRTAIGQHVDRAIGAAQTSRRPSWLRLKSPGFASSASRQTYSQSLALKMRSSSREKICGSVYTQWGTREHPSSGHVRTEFAGSASIAILHGRGAGTMRLPGETGNDRGYAVPLAAPALI